MPSPFPSGKIDTPEASHCTLVPGRELENGYFYWEKSWERKSIVIKDE